MGTTRRFLRNMDKVTLSNIGKAATLQKVVSTVTAMGFVLQPMAAMASTITRADAPNTNLANGAVTNIWAEKVVGDVAVNRFAKFQLDANNIANMYFKQSSTGAEAGNLVNFVNSRIDINGTVNAIKGSSVGGNLFFLSKDGMAVGKTGVINAGALYVAAPTSAAYSKYQSEANLKKLVDIKGSEGFASIPINASGTITVLGKVNAVNEVQLRAAKIGVGKNVSGEAVDGVAAGATAAGAALTTGVVNFIDLVNVKDTAGKTTVDAGLTGTLTASKDPASGDIVLAASADTVNTDTGFASALGSGVNGDTVQAVVDVAKYATITAQDGNIEITADASNDKGFLKKAASTSVAELFGGKVSKVEAKINIDGTLEAKSINIAANAENSYEKDSWTNVGTISGVLADSAMGLIPVEQLGDAKDKIDIAFAKLASNAEVNVGADASLTATGANKFEAEPDEDTGMLKGGALNISATSKLKAEIGAEVEAPDAPAEAAGGKAVTAPVSNKKNKNSLSSVLPSAGIAVADTENNASVIVKGNLQSDGDTNVSAHAINEVEAEAGVSTIENESGSAGSLVNAAVTVAKIKNAAKVELNGATTNVSGGELNAAAMAQNSVTTTAVAETDKDALASTAVNVTDARSSADLIIGGKVTAEKLNFTADNTVSNEIQAATQVGQSRFQTKSNLSGGALKAILGSVNSQKAKNNSKVNGGLGSYITAGAAVNIVDEANSAKVTIQKGAQLTAAASGVDAEDNPVNTINISANNTIEDSFMSATAVVNNFGGNKGNTTTSGNVSTGTSTGTALLASVGLLQADMDNSAQVVIEGKDSATKAPVIKGANIAIDAKSSFEYDRLKAMWENVKEDWEDKVTDGAAKTLYDKLDAKIRGHKDGDLDDALDIADFISTAQELKEIPETLTDFKDALLGFADASHYTNFHTSASTAGGNALGGANKNEAQLGITGSINLNSIKNNAQVIVGKGAKIDASVTDNNNNVTKGELNISATAKQHDVALNGKTKYFIPTISNTSGASTAIGGSVGVHDADVNSLVVVGEGARLSGNDVSLKAENDLQHTAITFGGGKAANQGITGMFAYMEGQSNSIISVDDEASISAAQKVALDANNNTTISNIIFDRTSAGGTAMGASIGIVDYKVNNIAAVADNDSDAKDDERDEVSNLRQLVYDQLAGKDDAGAQAEGLNVHLGAKAPKLQGSVAAGELTINAETSGTITGVSVAGTTSGANQTGSVGASGSNGKGFKLPAQLSGAGSGSVNLVQGNTAALLEGVQVEAADEQNTVSVSAADKSMIGAYSGAAALKKQGAGNSSKFGGTLAGAVAYNGVKTGVTAQIKDAAITDAQSITNLAAREGAVVAAGLALGVDTATTGGATSVNAGVSASVNEINNSTHAVMNNVKTSTSGGGQNRYCQYCPKQRYPGGWRHYGAIC